MPGFVTGSDEFPESLTMSSGGRRRRNAAGFRIHASRLASFGGGELPSPSRSDRPPPHEPTPATPGVCPLPYGKCQTLSKRRTDAGNRLWCILALKCDIWWQ